MTTSSPEPTAPATAPPQEGEARYRQLHGEPALWPRRAYADPTRAGVRWEEVPTTLDERGAPTAAVRPVSDEAAWQWDAALWHQGGRR